MTETEGRRRRSFIFASVQELECASTPANCPKLTRQEPFDELSAWIFSPTLTRHSHLISTQRGFLSDADPAQTCREISALQLDQAMCIFAIFPSTLPFLKANTVTPWSTGKTKHSSEAPEVVDVHAFQALRANQVDRVVEVSSVPNERIAVQSDACRRHKDVELRHNTLNARRRRATFIILLRALGEMLATSQPSADPQSRKLAIPL